MKDFEGGQLRETLGELGTVLTAMLLLKVPETAKEFPVEQTIHRRFHDDCGKFQKGFFRDGPGKGGKDKRRLETEKKAEWLATCTVYSTRIWKTAE